MVRRNLVRNAVLNVYRMVPAISFPIPVWQIAELFSNVRCQSYRRFAEINHSTLRDVCLALESKSGCTQYDVKRGRYLILLNDTETPGRVRWTCAHELGHILCGHFVETAERRGNSMELSQNPDFEREADLFASGILCPMPLFEVLEIHNASGVQEMFGISSEASNYTWLKYTRAKRFGESFDSDRELQDLFLKKRPQDELVFDVPHHSISIPEHFI